MITYLENLIGVSPGALTSDFGIVVCTILASCVVFALLKTFILWFDKLFNGG